MSNVKAVLEFIKLFVVFYQWAHGKITKEIFLFKVTKIRDAIRKANTGPLDDRLDGGSDVEDNFNRHAD